MKNDTEKDVTPIELGVILLAIFIWTYTIQQLVILLSTLIHKI